MRYHYTEHLGKEISSIISPGTHSEPSKFCEHSLTQTQKSQISTLHYHLHKFYARFDALQNPKQGRKTR